MRTTRRSVAPSSAEPVGDDPEDLTHRQGERLADAIGDDGASHAERLIRAHRCVLGGLVFDLGVQFGAEKHGHRRKPQPEHQAKDRPQRAIGDAKMREPVEAPGVHHRSPHPQGGRQGSAGRDPAPARQGAARAESVDQREDAGRRQIDHQPSQRRQPSAHVMHPQPVREHRGRYGEGGQRGKKQEARQGGEIGEHRAPDPRALLGLVIGDVDAVEERLHPGVRAPHRYQDAHDERRAERAVTRSGDPHHLCGDHMHRVGGEEIRDAGEVAFDVNAAGEYPVQRNEGRHGRKRRQLAP